MRHSVALFIREGHNSSVVWGKLSAAVCRGLGCGRMSHFRWADTNSFFTREGILMPAMPSEKLLYFELIHGGFQCGR
ncbi:hypothetical protein DSLASN_06350 [Desulfoluna limicola]|uniref:Uncharacterized protein n=1 Tax=Desulfoluna limicola TaxID=2810562 RepID=A0ABM7PCV3_9BACT|nr:hypothetical protein DSLASN_06350 [Desulfoluna limicola]